MLLNLPKALLNPESGIPSGLSDTELKVVEKSLNLVFPGAFRDWLAVTNAPCVGSGGFVGVNPNRKSLDIESIYANYPDWLELGWIPVANDGSGNYFVLLRDERDGELVAFVDVGEDPSMLAFVAASSLQKFIELFIGRQTGETRWPFNRDFVLLHDSSIESKKHIAPMPWG